MDLIRIYQYGVRTYGLIQADNYYDALIERFEEIAKHPYLYQTADNIHEGYRHSVCGSDSIFYRIVDDVVEIVRILGRQDVEKIL